MFTVAGVEFDRFSDLLDAARTCSMEVGNHLDFSDFDDWLYSVGTGVLSPAQFTELQQVIMWRRGSVDTDQLVKLYEDRRG